MTKAGLFSSGLAAASYIQVDDTRARSVVPGHFRQLEKKLPQVGDPILGLPPGSNSGLGKVTRLVAWIRQRAAEVFAEKAQAVPTWTTEQHGGTRWILVRGGCAWVTNKSKKELRDIASITW